MPRRKDDIEYADRSVKDHWLAVGLQPLTPNKFAAVVGKILKGNYSLVAPNREGPHPFGLR
jgi:hypothetical protein